MAVAGDAAVPRPGPRHDGGRAPGAAGAPGPDVARAARDLLGLPSLRPGQREAMDAAVAGRDVLAVLATGTGKSAIYQVAGALRGGTTVVVSPLIALQRDQLRGLGSHGGTLPGTAVELNSSDHVRDRREALEVVRSGRASFVLLAPEQLANDETVTALRAAAPRTFVVDEAHLVSEWGQDFRPDYLRLAAAVELLGRPPVVALTATAAPPVRAEILDRLALDDPLVVVRGFDRPEIWLGAHVYADETVKHRALLSAVQAQTGPGLVYCATHRRAEELAGELAGRGRRTGAYHAGLPAAQRRQVQDDFLADRLDVVVATVAFGMGVDKPDVRWVFHAEASQSVDSYYQEMGRAGRDRASAEARLFHRRADLGLRTWFASRGGVYADDVAQVLAVLADGDVHGEDDLRTSTGASHTRLQKTLTRLVDVGVVRVGTDGGAALAADPEPGSVQRAQEAVAAAEHDRHEVERSRVAMMGAYAEHRYCRRAWLLAYFGEEYEPPCGRCDSCAAGRGVAPVSTSHPFPVGSRVLHTAFGGGLVERYEGEEVSVLFDRVGYKVLRTALTVTAGLLRPEADGASGGAPRG